MLNHFWNPGFLLKGACTSLVSNFLILSNVECHLLLALSKNIQLYEVQIHLARELLHKYINWHAP